MYPENSHVVVSDEFMLELRVKAWNGRLAIEHNQDMGVLKDLFIRMTESETNCCSFSIQWGLLAL